jgi:hypothetical protein
LEILFLVEGSNYRRRDTPLSRGISVGHMTGSIGIRLDGSRCPTG